MLLNLLYSSVVFCDSDFFRVICVHHLISAILKPSEPQISADFCIYLSCFSRSFRVFRDSNPLALPLRWSLSILLLYHFPFPPPEFFRIPIDLLGGEKFPVEPAGFVLIQWNPLPKHLPAEQRVGGGRDFRQVQLLLEKILQAHEYLQPVSRSLLALEHHRYIPVAVFIGSSLGTRTIEDEQHNVMFFRKPS